MRPGQQWLLPYAWVQDTEPAVEAEGQRFQGHPGTVTTGPAPVACPVCPAAALQKPSQPSPLNQSLAARAPTGPGELWLQAPDASGGPKHSRDCPSCHEVTWGWWCPWQGCATPDPLSPNLMGPQPSQPKQEV